MNEAYAEAPVLKNPDEIIECVFKLGENQEALVRVVKEPFLMEKAFEARELRFRSRFFDALA